GNGAQYTWAVPQGWPALVAALGGSRAAQQRLDAFFTELNAGQNKPYAWFGNEPSLVSSWVYLYAGAPYRASIVNRTVMRDLYEPTPDGIPGNDDLGTMSAWWAWNAIGLYPANPVVPMLFAGAPLFTHVTIASPSGRVIDLDAPGALADNIFVTGVRENGRAVDRVWFSLPERGLLRLHYDLASTPNESFAVSPHSVPPAYAYGPVTFPPATPLQFAIEGSAIALTPGSSATVELMVQNTGASNAAAKWTAHAPYGITLTPQSASAQAAGGQTTTVQFEAHAANGLIGGLYDVPVAGIAQNGAPIARATAILRVARPGEVVPLAYVANFSDGTVTPFDPRTFGYGAPIRVGKSPGGLALSSDGMRLYTTNQNSNDVSVVDTQAQKTVATIAVGKVPAGIQLTHDGKHLWFANYGDGTLQSIDTATLHPNKPILVGPHLEGLTLSPDGTRAYVVVQGTNALAVVDLSSGEVLERVNVGRLPVGVAITHDGKTLYVGNSAGNDVTAIDTTTLRTLATIPVGKSPQGLTVSPDDSQVYVAAAASAQITPIDARSNTAGSPIAVGYGPFDVAFTADGRYAFAANSGDNTISVIDVARRKIVQNIATGSFPIALAQ
ncbi:MAG: glycoside hydrolase family 92 protein, partial [Candidatus Eremiobacteraeota bacterium]|nr:glycoside hydrolase family 92 protein [Candidatus Eremiobacteraeota bacterium]